MDLIWPSFEQEEANIRFSIDRVNEQIGATCAGAAKSPKKGGALGIATKWIIVKVLRIKYINVERIIFILRRSIRNTSLEALRQTWE